MHTHGVSYAMKVLSAGMSTTPMLTQSCLTLSGLPPILSILRQIPHSSTILQAAMEGNLPEVQVSAPAGVPQGDPNPGGDGWDDPSPPPLEEEDMYEPEWLPALIIDQMVPGYLPACRWRNFAPACFDRDCRIGIAFLAYLECDLVITSDGLTVTQHLTPGLHLISWCNRNLHYGGIEVLDPNNPGYAEDCLYFRSGGGTAWVGLTPQALGGLICYDYPIEENPLPYRVACLVTPAAAAGAAAWPAQVNLGPYLPDAKYYHLYMTDMPAEGPLLSSTNHMHMYFHADVYSCTHTFMRRYFHAQECS